MYSDRPKIKVPFETVDYIAELASIAILIIMWCYVFMEYQSLPDIIPTHFNAAGIADDYGSKNTLFIIPSVATGIYILLFILNLYPHIHNYSVNITQENAHKNYKFSVRFLRIFNFFMCLMFGYITHNIVISTHFPEQGISPYFLPILVGFCVALPVLAIYFQRKINKSKK
ncbi:DUF1648 domain-containing protein [Paucihalobacter sp.]|uniref:DUF1648 domain-containing protein n=1 Tax=Paucihalobacter sp. TaxID=2850405 RepID=UPI002FDFC07B